MNLVHTTSPGIDPKDYDYRGLGDNTYLAFVRMADAAKLASYHGVFVSRDHSGNPVEVHSVLVSHHQYCWGRADLKKKTLNPEP